MSNPNPLIPQGSLLDQQAKTRPHLRIALCIVAVHLVFIGGLLMQGCKRDENPLSSTADGTNDTLPPLDTNSFASTWPDPVTNEFAAPITSPIGSNPVAATSAPPESVSVAPPITMDVAPLGSSQEYTVAKGDSFYSIGRKFGVSATAIAKANAGVDPTRLRIGQKLMIPAATTATGSTGFQSSATVPGMTSGGGEQYTVKAGDTLTRIARMHNTTVSALRQLNGLKTDRINVGQKLNVPSRDSALPSNPPPSNPGI